MNMLSYKKGIMLLALGLFTLASCDKDDDDQAVWRANSATEIYAKLPEVASATTRSFTPVYTVFSAEQRRWADGNGSVYKVYLRPASSQFQLGGEIEIEFDLQGVWVEVEERHDSFIHTDILEELGIPEVMIQSIVAYNTAYYTSLESVKRTVGRSGYIVEFNNDWKIMYDAQGQQVGTPFRD